MRVAHTRFSQLAFFAAGGLVLAQVAVLGSVHADYMKVMVGSLALITALAATKLCRDNCVESRLVTAIVATVSAAGITLHSTLGLPGTAATALDAPATVLLGLALAVLLLMAIDTPSRRAVLGDESPYAL